MYEITREEVFIQQKEFRDDYPEFVPFELTKTQEILLLRRFCSLLKTQNGCDFDDYPTAGNGNNVGKYLSRFPSGSKVLILGTGTGREVRVAREMGFSAVGTTLGSRNIAFGQRVVGLGPEENIECTNEVLPFAKETFDVVAGFQVFEHTIAPLIFLLEISRVLRFGGTCLLEWPSAIKGTDGSPHHQICFVPGQAEGLMQKAGFDKIKIYYNDLSPVSYEDWWRGDVHQDKHICIEGVKVPDVQDHVKCAWECGY